MKAISSDKSEASKVLKLVSQWNIIPRHSNKYFISAIHVGLSSKARENTLSERRKGVRRKCYGMWQRVSELKNWILWRTAEKSSLVSVLSSSFVISATFNLNSCRINIKVYDNGGLAKSVLYTTRKAFRMKPLSRVSDTLPHNIFLMHVKINII